MIELMTKSHQFIHKREVETTWEQLLLLADGDFVSFILLSLAGKAESTALWLPAHSIEKYLKGWLLKNDPDFIPRRFGHRLEDLWCEARGRFPGNEVFQEPSFEVLVHELNMDNGSILLRYSYGITLENPIFTRMYTLLSCLLRENILGQDVCEGRGPYGIDDFSFGSVTHFLEKSKIDTKRLVCEEIERLLTWPMV
jgi:hypothetical protein